MDHHALIGLRVAAISRDPELGSSSAMAVRKDWPVLRDILQKGMDALGDEEIAALRRKWLGAESTQVTGEDRLDLTNEERAWISGHPVIRVHNEMNWPPFNFNVNGLPRGFSIDLMNLVAANAGLDVEYISGPAWDEFKEMLQSGGLDVLNNVDTSPPAPDYAILTSN